MATAIEEFVHEEEEVDHPMKYLPIRHVYSSTTPCINPSGSSNVMSKKVKAHRLVVEEEEEEREDEGKGKKALDPHPGGLGEANGGKPILVYRRRRKRHRHLEATEVLVKEERKEEGGDWSEIGPDSCGDEKIVKKRKMLKYELLGLGDASGSPGQISGTRLRGSGGLNKINFSEVRRRGRGASEGSSGVKKWVELDVGGADPETFVGMECKVFWPNDEKWYKGSVMGYQLAMRKHRIEYDDKDVEDLYLTEEKIKFYISSEEMQRLNLKCFVSKKEKKGRNYDEMLALAASDDCQDLEAGDLIWAKITGYSMWPAVIVNEEVVACINVLKPTKEDQSVPVQFFGTHDFARIKLKQTFPFLNGLFDNYHLGCKSKNFHRSLDEAKLYLSRHKLPKSMLQLQKGLGASGADDGGTDSCEDLSGDEILQKTVEGIKAYPLEIGDLHIINLGKIVNDSDYFHNKQYIWPEGYTAFRKFASLKDPSLKASYKMEVLRDPKLKSRPLFRVTTDDGEEYDGSNPTACWKEVYEQIRKNQCDGFNVEAEGCDFSKSGNDMFGFSNPEISQLIQDMRNSRFCSKSSDSCWDLPMGYRAVRVDWKDLDRCSVCHMDEEYEDNLFLQCDKCRMMVHARCYGELGPLDGVLWLCNLCRPGAPKSPPPCCLCPVIGGAIKPTTDGRWAHLACAMWIPETCLVDVKRMEPIDGLRRINKDRWKLLCSICGVSYGACIQCSNSTCRVAYHPLCARAAGLCVELEDEERIHLSFDEDDDQCIRLLSFCKKHRQPCKEHPPADEKLLLPDECGSSYVPASNPSGCARSEPYNFFGRRGQKEPQVLAAASVKRLFVENKPYLVSGYRQNGIGCGTSYSESLQNLCSSPKWRNQHETFGIVSSMAEKYKNMKTTFRKRLAFGKSRIHGFGVFAKLPHKAGDMVIEYTGELVRPSIADIREHCIYNSLVGAGTYMFRIDDERVIDATRAGSVAHLINHSCEPNCYSRVITVNGDEHIIIFAKRDLKQWEELTYDYRFFSKDERLACYCGFPRCRGVVNDIEAEEQVAKIWVPRSDLIHWRGD